MRLRPKPEARHTGATCCRDIDGTSQSYARFWEGCEATHTMRSEWLLMIISDYNRFLSIITRNYESLYS